MVNGVQSPAAPPSVGRAGPSWPWRAVWPAALVFLAFVPLLAVHARMLWARPHYKFFPLVIPAALVLAWRAGRNLGPLLPGDRRTSTLGAIAGWSLLALGVLFVSPGLGAVGALATLLAAIYTLGGVPLARSLLPAWCFLWLAIPLPRRFDILVITGLQDLVSRWSSTYLDAIGVFHVMEGNIVDLPSNRLLVDQACSGIYSLLTLLIGTLFYSLWTRAAVLRTAFLLAAAIFWVVFGNIVRIVSIVVLSVRFNIDASKGMKHEALGLVIFVMMLAMVASTDCLYRLLTSLGMAAAGWARGGRDSAEGMGLADPAYPVPTLLGPTALVDPRRTWVGSLRSGLIFGVLLLPQWLMPGVDWKEVLSTNDVYAPLIGKLEENSLPRHWEKFDRVGFKAEHREMDDSWGENSRVWYFRDGVRGAVVSADYQFVDWHELTVCYESAGWRKTARTVGVADAEDRPDSKYVVAVDFINPEGWYGYLVYGLYGRDGRPSPPPEAIGFLQFFGSRLVSWLRGGGAKSQQTVARLNHQIQVFVESESPLSLDDRERVLRFYEAMRTEIQREGLGLNRVAAATEVRR